jgi:cell division protein FtsL
MHAAERKRETYHVHSSLPARKVMYETEKTVRKNDVQKSYIPETCALLFCIAAILVLNLFLLGRFADITSTKHQVSQMEKKMEQLQNQREQLAVSIEKSSRLDWIEQEAVARLNMQYPDKNQIIYISVDPVRVQLVAGQMKHQVTDDVLEGSILPQSIEKIFHKFAGVLRI